jgi:hypothetical protein
MIFSRMIALMIAQSFYCRACAISMLKTVRILKVTGFPGKIIHQPY